MWVALEYLRQNLNHQAQQSIPLESSISGPVKGAQRIYQYVFLPFLFFLSFLPFVFLFMHPFNKYLLLSPKHGGFSGDQDKPDLCLHRGETDRQQISSPLPKGIGLQEKIFTNIVDPCVEQKQNFHNGHVLIDDMFSLPFYLFINKETLEKYIYFIIHSKLFLFSFIYFNYEVWDVYKRQTVYM